MTTKAYLKDKYTSRKDYQNQLLTTRFSAIFNAMINDKKLKYVIDYGAKTEKIFQYYEKNKDLFNQYFSKVSLRTKIPNIKSKDLYEVDLTFKNSNRTVRIIETPFFGNGQMSYKAMEELVNYVKD